MTRARCLRAQTIAALLGTVLVATLLAVPAATAAEGDAATPLVVRLVRMSPATLPASGALVLAGTVRNVSQETWSAINVHPFVGATPITTREELAEAAASDPETEVGQRITEAGQFAPIGDLEPGGTARFAIRIPVADLGISRAPGVYWIGVHALGQNGDGRDELADGRARTFIPRVGPGDRTDVSLVVPLREQVRRDRSGRLLDGTDWSATLAPEGRLRRVVDFLTSAGSAQATLLVDPAVLEAVESVAADNPALSLGPAPEDDPDEEPTEPSEPAEPSGESGATGAAGPSARTTSAASRSAARPDATDRDNAETWLEHVIDVATGHSVLGLAFADPDTSSLARRKAAMLRRAERLSGATFARLGIPAVTPAVAPPSGWLDEQALTEVSAGSLVLVSDHDAPRNRTQWRTRTDQDLVFTDARAADGGPGPTDSLGALALRQRILADAALRAADGAGGTMVVTLPPDWDPGAGWQAARFFDGLDQPWLQLTGVRQDLTNPTFDAALGYPAAERAAEIGARNIASARQLVITATTLNQVLRSKNQVDHLADGIALSAVSYHARQDPTVASIQVLATDAALRERLARIEVIGTDFVTLSGGSGTLAVTLVNGLDQPIVVGVKADTGNAGVRISTPEPLAMAPGESTVLRLNANASAIGVHAVSLSPVTAGGLDLGTPLTFRLRTSEVGTLIWFVLIAGAGLLVVMIGRRILRGVREHRWRGQ